MLFLLFFLSIVVNLRDTPVMKSLLDSTAETSLEGCSIQNYRLQTNESGVIFISIPQSLFKSSTLKKKKNNKMCNYVHVSAIEQEPGHLMQPS